MVQTETEPIMRNVHGDFIPSKSTESSEEIQDFQYLAPDVVLVTTLYKTWDKESGNERLLIRYSYLLYGVLSIENANYKENAIHMQPLTVDVTIVIRRTSVVSSLDVLYTFIFRLLKVAKKIEGSWKLHMTCNAPLLF